MKWFFLFFILLSQIACPAQTPAGFTWVNLESDKTTMTAVRHALNGKSLTAIREVGVEDGFALVMTATREKDAPTPDYDLWSIYSISLATGKAQILVSGYSVKTLDWIGPGAQELVISYYDCWECEPATLFTSLHFRKSSGWSARWPNKTKDANYPHPGAVVFVSDAGAPYDDDEVDQVFSVVAQPNDGFAAGYWSHSRNTKTGKIEDTVSRLSVNPTTGADRYEELHGPAAEQWKHMICSTTSLVVNLGGGQDSKACRAVLHSAGAQKPAGK